jgi:hypothetical protein
VEGLLAHPGLFADAGRTFPGLGLIALSRGRLQEQTYGLYPTRRALVGSWSVADTAEAISVICDAHNDDVNSRAFQLSYYETDGVGETDAPAP